MVSVPKSPASVRVIPTQLNVEKRMTWLKVIVAGSFLLELLLSWRLWSGFRTFPELPLFNLRVTTPLYLDATVFVLLLSLLVVTIVHPKPQTYAYLFLALVALLAALDQVRWYPYFFQYYFMLLALCFFAWSKRDSDKERALTSCRWMVASMYFYGGLQKVNANFVSEVFPWFVEPITRLFPSVQPFLIVNGLFIPFLEMSIGVGLLVKGYRTYAVCLAWVMHVFILLMLGPLGHDWGKGVLPWNVSMMTFVFLLSWRVDVLPLISVSARKRLLQHCIIALFWIMPLLSFFNLWDSHLSATMYSGNTNRAQIFITAALKETLPAPVQAYSSRTRDGTFALDYFHWSYDELGVLVPPETRIFKGIARYLCGYARHPSDVTLVVQGKPTSFRPDRPTTYTCTSLSDERVVLSRSSS
jgi:hypothetical protein